MSSPEDPARLFEMGFSGSSPFWEPPPAESVRIPGIRVERLAGRGGMGAVYAGVQTSVERPVAVKLLPPELAPDVIQRERFMREARVLASLDHPHILRLIESGETDAGALYLVMDWASGGDLRTLLKGRKVTPAEATNWISQVAEGLDHAHRAGVIHRDLKPANLLLDDAGSIKIADFGLAAATGTGFTTQLTMSGTTMGTLDYMAPEQFEPGHIPTVQSDIFSLGVLSYELLTGRLPKGAFAPASKLAGLPPRVDAVLHQALAPDPADRHASPGEFAQALQAALVRKRRIALPLAAAGLGAAVAVAVLIQQETPVTDRAPAVQNATPAETNDGWQLLSGQINPARDTRAGTWTPLAEGLRSNDDRCILALPAPPAAEYDLRVSFTRLSGVHSVAIFVTTSRGPATFELDAWELGLGGLQDFNGNDLRRNGIQFPAKLENGKKETVLVEVRADTLRILRNDQVAVQKTLSPAAQFTINPLWQTATPTGIGVGSWNSPTWFHSIEYRVIRSK